MANKLIVSAAPHITSADSTSKIMGRVCIALLPTLIASVLIFGFQALLLTGLVNPQVIRTAEMMDMHCIIFVRGKRPDETVLSLARQKDITILATPYRMFTACGLLYENGLEGGCDVS